MHSQEGKRGPNEAENQLAKYTLSNHTHQHKAAKHTQSRRLVTLDTSFGLRPLANKVNYLYSFTGSLKYNSRARTYIQCDLFTPVSHRQ